jgi:hypothetical protein
MIKCANGAKFGQNVDYAWGAIHQILKTILNSDSKRDS